MGYLKALALTFPTLPAIAKLVSPRDLRVLTGTNKESPFLKETFTFKPIVRTARKAV